MVRKWQVLVAVCFGTYLATMDFSIVNVALPTLAEDFDTSPDRVVWTTLIFSLAVTGLTLTAGRAGDLWGRKRLYLVGWAIFSVGLLASGLAGSLAELLVGRIIQSVGAAFIMATGNALITSAFPDFERGRALGTSGAVVGAGLMSGPLLGGVILEAFDDWQAIFLLRVPAGLVAFLVAYFVIHESSHDQPASGRLDIPGAMTLFAAMTSTLFALNQGHSLGWSSPVIATLFAVGAVLFVGFMLIERRASSPVVALNLFRVRSYSVGVVSLALSFAGQATTIFLMPFYLIAVRDYSTTHAGLIITTIPAMMLLLSPVSGYISDRFRIRHQTTVGITMVSVGLFSLSTLGPDTPDALVVMRLLVIGIGIAIFMSPNSSQIMGSVPRSMLGTASASVATSRNIGNSTGLAVASTVVVVVAGNSANLGSVQNLGDLPRDALLDGLRAAFFAAGAISATAIAASLFRSDSDRAPELDPLGPAAKPADSQNPVG